MSYLFCTMPKCRNEGKMRIHYSQALDLEVFCRIGVSDASCKSKCVVCKSKSVVRRDSESSWDR